jgi:LacI family gluconate utilization system Gnt-I transcriptional repressor
VDVPGDLSVMGFGDFEIGRDINPPLTTVHVDFHALGRLTGETILELLATPGQPARIIDVGLSVVERASVGRPRK